MRSIAKQYYEKAMRLRQARDVGRADENFRGAKRVYERIIQFFDENSPHIPVAYYFSGRMCHLLRYYACAAANFQTAVEGWPDYRYAGGAQCAVGYCYEAMVKLGEISEAEAQPVIEEAYERVLERYPDCYLADYAALQLGEMNFARGDFAAAMSWAAFSFFVQGEAALAWLVRSLRFVIRVS